ncbi:HNH endonuclease family protein [Nonomuraea rhizosphaerae]|uniref:HNH endonuclease family protein n=1 Tax=Nonomuraea rhizosphaerae TaxID=2665663 RepID=UPI001C5DF03F|nr:HNH endonuclease family protein [Nonomuraea rhizosphaerae]
MHRSRALSAALGTVCATALVLPITTQPAAAIPPNIPSAATATSRLATLTVAAESHSSTYDRDLFPHWITVSGSCNTREEVLKRDGTSVVTDSSCAAVSGSWYSPYDGATWTAASDVDIDHMVPLAEAWASGAWAWTTARRQTYANDLGGPELWAVTDNVNQSKGDKDPAEWQPSRTAERCRYARAWIQVKYFYALTVDSAEKSALTTMLGTC